MDYPIKTLSQLRPILQGFRKAAGLTQAAMAERLGITQQSYAQLEANPASVSVERLFKVLRMLDVEMSLIQVPAVSTKISTATTEAGAYVVHATNRGADNKGTGRIRPGNLMHKSGTPASMKKTEKVTGQTKPRRIVATTKKKESW